MGLPVHPLVVHAAVVLLPLAFVGLLAVVALPKLAKTYGWLALAFLALGVVTSWAAKESGEKLAGHVGEPKTHAELGNQMPLFAAVWLVIAVVWFVVQLRANATQKPRSALALSLGVATLLVGALNIFWIYRVGDSGAKAVWQGEISASPAPSAQAAGTYTLAQVAEHKTATDCWTVVNGAVYDMTKFVQQHPGGPDRIIALCGIDGTSAFRGQHDGAAKPNNALAGYEIGKLAGASAAPSAAISASPTTSASPASYTMNDVKKHNVAADCWSAVDGNVYDLTGWVGKHPGGPARIISMCGKDGTSTFHGEHGTEKKPNSVLAGYEVGVLS